MKNYKNFEKQYIGYSDGATLYAESAEGTTEICFGEDGDYRAYIVTGEDVKIGDHYRLVADLAGCVQIRDDERYTTRFTAEKVRIWRAGEFGCIVQLINPLDPDCLWVSYVGGGK